MTDKEAAEASGKGEWTMYICPNCGETFDEPETYVERHCPPGLIYTETYVGCPRCGSGYDELDGDEWSELCGVTIRDEEL